MARTAALYAGPAALLAWSWLRLGHPHAGASTALWLMALAVAPALLSRPRWRAVATVPAAVLALHSALGVWIIHPIRLLGRFGGGFLEFYDVRLPFFAVSHPRMDGVILVAFYASGAAVAMAIAARKPVLASAAVVVAAGWPATLLTGPDDLLRGVALLAAVLSLVVGLGGPLRPRRLAVGALVGGTVVLAAFAASTSSAVASGQVLHWQGWDFYTKPPKPVTVEYVWNSNFRGLHFPKKVTTVLTIKAPSKSTYWRATTLDEFDGGNWYESSGASVAPTRINGRDELRSDPELPPAANDSRRWVRQEVTVGALSDSHLIGASVPVAYSSRTHLAQYGVGGIALLQDRPIGPGDTYTVWSFQAQPTPRQLAKLKVERRLVPLLYSEQVRKMDLYVEARVTAPPFGAPDRERRVAQIFATSYRARPYEALYKTARRIVGDPSSPYAAALELEAWFRSGAFTYDPTPPQSSTLPPLVAFVTQTYRGYCQHFAGAMALMLRYLGIPARVAAGFTSGVYDSGKHEWTVTDHDAHTWVEAWFPRYGWLPFDPTPGRGSLNGTYTSSSPRFDLTDGLFAVTQNLKKAGAFNLRTLRAAHGNATGGGTVLKIRPKPGPAGSRIGSLLRLLVLVAAAVFEKRDALERLVVFLAAAKLVIRKRRYVTRDPRKLARACVRELSDFVSDQGAKAPPSATLGELAKLVEAELGVSASSFVSAAAEARFGPTTAAGEAARSARRELRSLRRELRKALTRTERALGLVSLRSLGLTG